MGYLFCNFLGIAVVATESADSKSLSLLTEIIQRDQHSTASLTCQNTSALSQDQSKCLQPELIHPLYDGDRVYLKVKQCTQARGAKDRDGKH